MGGMQQTAIAGPAAADRHDKRATLYRMVMPSHVCPFGLKALHLLHSQGYEVDDHWLETRAQTDAFKTEHGVKTTPQAFVGDQRIGGYDDTRRFFGKSVRDAGATSYRPVVAVFAMAALMALAASMAVLGSPFTVRAAMWFISFSMCVLAILKLQDVETFRACSWATTCSPSAGCRTPTSIPSRKGWRAC